MRFSSTGTVTGRVPHPVRHAANCAGGEDPCGNTWLSCEEVSLGYVYEADPLGRERARSAPRDGPLQARGRRRPTWTCGIYLTEDERRTAASTASAPRPGQPVSGRAPGAASPRTATSAPSPGRTSPTRTSSPPRPAPRSPARSTSTAARAATTPTTRSGSPPRDDNRVRQVNLTGNTYELAYDDSLVTSGTAPPPASTTSGSASGDLFVARRTAQHGDLRHHTIDVVAPFLRIDGQSDSPEITGPGLLPTAPGCTSPASAARGSSSGGITYEVRAVPA